MLSDNFAYKIEQIEDKDWEREWMDHFHPMQFGKRLWICPSWREIPDPSAVNVMLDSGPSIWHRYSPNDFSMFRVARRFRFLEGKTVIDFGCGSGILAIAAIKLGAAKVIAIDIDPQAILASRDNAERNGVADQLELFLPQDQPEGLIADVVVANILAGPLRDLSDVITSLVKPKGLLAMSGVLDSQAADVATYYQDAFELDPIIEQQEWCRISGQKNP